MAKKIILSLLLLMLFSSCRQIGPAFLVLRGNYHTRQGMYQQADVDYLKAGEQSNYQEWIYYNKGNIYYSLGETESALQAWDLSENPAMEDLLFRLSFNRGVLYYDQGDFQSAYIQFRKALELNPVDLDAKINLELTLAKISGDRNTIPDQPSGDQNNGLMDDTERLLYYIQSKEQYQWSDQQQESPSAEQDW